MANTWWATLPVGTIFDITSRFRDPPSSTVKNASTELVRASPRESMANYAAEFNYIAKEIDEISLEKGDILHVEEKGTDNWFYGTNLSKQTRGTFPGNFVSLLGPIGVTSPIGVSFMLSSFCQYHRETVLPCSRVSCRWLAHLSQVVRRWIPISTPGCTWRRMQAGR